MKVFFIKTLRGKGSVGDIKEVPDGYALNFLIAQKYAVRATDDIIKKHQQEITTKQQTEQQQLVTVQQIFAQLKNISVTYQATKKDLKGHLYQGITVNEIISCVRSQHNIIIDSHWFDHYKPIKETGTHAVTLHYGKINTVFNLIVQ